MDVPERLGRYQLARMLGRGTSAAVFAGCDPRLDRPVAIKVFAQHIPIKEVEHEGSVLALVTHPNVIAIHDIGEVDGFAFLVMDLGVCTLANHIKGRHDWRELVDMFIELGRGVAAVHAAGFTHGDIKPSNILLDGNGRALLADFGIASASADTSERRYAGSLPYMAPERRLKAWPDPLSDQFSFCVSLWEALHGVRPWDSNLPEYVGERPPKRPRSGPAPASLDRVLLRGLAVDPRQRFENMSALVDALIDVSTETDRWRARWRSISIALASVALAGMFDRCM